MPCRLGSFAQLRADGSDPYYREYCRQVYILQTLVVALPIAQLEYEVVHSSGVEYTPRTSVSWARRIDRTRPIPDRRPLSA